MTPEALKMPAGRRTALLLGWTAAAWTLVVLAGAAWNINHDLDDARRDNLARTTQRLGLVDDQDDLMALALLHDQKVVESCEEFPLGALLPQSEFVIDLLEEFDAGKDGVEYVGVPGRLWWIGQKRTQERRLASPDLPGDRDESRPFLEPVDEMAQGLPVLVGQKEVARIRREAEGWLLETKESLVHGRLGPGLPGPSIS